MQGVRSVCPETCTDVAVGQQGAMGMFRIRDMPRSVLGWVVDKPACRKLFFEKALWREIRWRLRAGADGGMRRAFSVGRLDSVHRPLLVAETKIMTCQIPSRSKRKGFLTLEWIFLITIVVIGIIGGLGAVRNSLVTELVELADSITNIITP